MRSHLHSGRARVIYLFVALALFASMAQITRPGGWLPQRELTSGAGPQPLAPAGVIPGVISGGDGAPAAPGGPASGPIVSQNVKHDVSPPLSSMPPAPAQTRPRREYKNDVLPIRRAPGPAKDPVLQYWSSPLLMPVPLLNSDGVGQGFSGPNGTFVVNSAPPDTNGAVGPNHYVQVVNTDFAIFNKAGTPVYGPVPINTLWSGFGGGCQTNNDGDPTVVYDRIADRWVISQFSVSTTPYLQCVAVSQSPDPTGAYNRYAFSYGTGFNDYPKIGVWPDGYYVTYNMFTNGASWAGAEICAFDRTRMLAGQSATQQCFNAGTAFGGLLPSDLDGARLPPAGAPNTIVGLGWSPPNTLDLWQFHVDWASPANTTFLGPTTLPVAAFGEACGGGTCIPQPGTSVQLDSLADRLMYRLAYRNYGDHEALVTNHTVTAGSAVGVRWYEIRNPGTTPSIFQQGTYAPDSNYRWMGSIAMDRDGDMALGFSVSSSTVFPSIRYTGRLAGDAAGTMTQGESTIIAGGGAQVGFLNRWGDYSAMQIDPSDDCTFWYTTEYIPVTGSFNWRTRIATFKFPGCGSVSTATPTATPTNTPTATDTPTATATNTPTATDTPTATATNTPTATSTPSNTPTNTSTPSDTPTATSTPSNTPTNTATTTPTYTPTVTPSATPTPGTNGCSPGYWKNHPTAWPAPYTPNTTLGSVFTLPACNGLSSLGSDTFRIALNYSGGATVKQAAQSLLRQGVAALLNAASGIGYPLNQAQIRSEVNAALASCNTQTITWEANRLDHFNNSYCPLH